MQITMENQWKHCHNKSLESSLFKDVKICGTHRDFVWRHEDFIEDK
jgi:ligand-binding SRPBCC domain-containing protein